MKKLRISDVQKSSFVDFDTLQNETGLLVSKHMKNFFCRNCCLYGQKLDCAYFEEKGNVVALWVYDSSSFRNVTGSHGTYVENKHRRRGLASLLWQSVPGALNGIACSNAGFGFLYAVSRKRDEVSFEDGR